MDWTLGAVMANGLLMKAMSVGFADMKIPITTTADITQELDWRKVAGARWKRTRDNFAEDTFIYAVLVMALTLESVRSLRPGPWLHVVDSAAVHESYSMNDCMTSHGMHADLWPIPGHCNEPRARSYTTVFSLGHWVNAGRSRRVALHSRFATSADKFFERTCRTAHATLSHRFATERDQPSPPQVQCETQASEVHGSRSAAEPFKYTPPCT